MNSFGRRALAEFIGTAFLVAAVIGSGIAAERLSPNDVGLELLENAVITGGALVALILALQPVSAAFNPVATLVERALGVVSTREAAAMVAAQFAVGSPVPSSPRCSVADRVRRQFSYWARPAGLEPATS